MAFPLWLVPVLIDLGGKAISAGIDALKDNADETDTKVDDKILAVTDKILEHKVNQTDTVMDVALKATVTEALKRIQ